MTRPAIELEHVTKRYRLGSERGNVWGIRPGSDPAKGRVATVVENVSLALDPGDRLAVVGPNGAGKSTLLRLIAHVTTPTEGRVRTHGRVAAMLDLGSAFHPDLTGRENVAFAGAVIGVPADELKRRYDEIVEFAGVERFMDTPIKRFSAGMAARLGFAVATAVQAEILLIDEVLGVGDIDFRTRSLARISERAAEGATIVIVSHNLGILPDLCNLGLHLEAGRVLELGPAREVVEDYIGTEPGAVGAPEPLAIAPGDLDLSPASVASPEGFAVSATFSFDRCLEAGNALLRARASDGATIGEYPCPDPLPAARELHVEARMNWFPMVADTYDIDLVVREHGGEVAVRTATLQVTGDDGTRAAQALLASFRDHAIAIQVDWSASAR